MSVRELLTKEQIADRIKWISDAVSADFKNKPLTVVPILTGAFIFAADLVRKIKVKDLQIDFVDISSYGDATESSGTLKLGKDLSRSVVGRHILIVEDVVDTGYTISFLTSHLAVKGAESVSVCSLIDKPTRRRVPVRIDYPGFTVGDEFVVGYGMDCAGKCRELPFIGVMIP